MTKRWKDATVVMLSRNDTNQNVGTTAEFLLCLARTLVTTARPGLLSK